MYALARAFFSQILEEKPTLETLLMKHFVADAIPNSKADYKRHEYCNTSFQHGCTSVQI